MQLARFQPGVGDVQLSINSFLKSRHLNAEDVLNLANEAALELAEAMGPLMPECSGGWLLLPKRKRGSWPSVSVRGSDSFG